MNMVQNLLYRLVTIEENYRRLVTIEENYMKNEYQKKK